MKNLDSVLEHLLSETRSKDDDSLLSLVRRAGAAIMEHYQSDSLSVQEKSDHSPVTNADFASHEIIKKDLPKFVDVPILSEEEIPPAEEYRAWDKFWLLDPLDGTKEFVRGRPEFTINVALIEDARPVFGIIYVPVQDQIYYAARGLGGYSAKAGQEFQQLHVAAPGAKGHTLVSGNFHPGGRTDRFVSKLQVANKKSLGSAIKFGIVAEGSADIYPRFAPTCLWDTAPGQCLIEEAGGMVLDPNLQPLSYGLDKSLENPPFIACTHIDKDWSSLWQEIAASPSTE